MQPDIIAVNGRKIRTRRYAKGLKVLELAATVGISPSHLSAIELGHKQPSPSLLVKLAKELGLTSEALLEPDRKPRATKVTA